MTRARRSSGAPAQAPPLRRIAIYTRKSTEKGLEQDFNSLDAQREACETYVRSQAHLGWTLVPESYDDGGFTGANLERPAFQRLLVDIDARRIDVVVVYKVDRLSRSLLDFAQVMERFNAGGAAFVSVTQNFSTADAMGRLTLNMLMSFAEFEREMIAERTSDKMRAARRRGKWTGGPVPFGYDVCEKKLLVNDLEAPVVREIFRMYVEHRSPLAIVRALKAKRVMTKRGRDWTTAQILGILQSPVYGGHMRCGEEVHAAEHVAIVEPAVFERVRAALEDTRGERAGSRNPAYLLGGVIHCAECGAAYTPASTRRGGQEYRYYRCVTRDKRGREACPGRPVPAAAVEAEIVRQLRAATTDGALALEVTAAAKARATALRTDLEKACDRLPTEIARLSAEAERLAEAVAKGTAPGVSSVLEPKMQEVGEKLARYRAQLHDAERERRRLEAHEVEAGWVATCLAEFDTIWDVLSLENRARLVRAVVERIDIGVSGQIRITLADIGVPLVQDRKEPAA